MEEEYNEENIDFEDYEHQKQLEIEEEEDLQRIEGKNYNEISN